MAAIPIDASPAVEPGLRGPARTTGPAALDLKLGPNGTIVAASDWPFGRSRRGVERARI